MTTTALTIALALYIEAAGEPELGIRYVASVLHNRANERNLTYRQVIAQKKQISGWTKAKRRIKYDEARYEGRNKWELCKRIGTDMAAGRFLPITNATHFYNPRLANPSWGRKLVGVKVVGNHKFGRLK